MKNSDSPNIEELYFDIQNRALKASFDIETLVFGNVPGVKDVFLTTIARKNSDSPNV